jgi:hypothetical protein
MTAVAAVLGTAAAALGVLSMIGAERTRRRTQRPRGIERTLAAQSITLKPGEVAPPLESLTQRPGRKNWISVVCHAHRLGGDKQDVFASASGIGVRPDRDELAFFPNIHNEDWFFFANEAAQHRIAKAGESRQKRDDPYERGRAVQDEFGNLLAEGLYARLDNYKGIRAATRTKRAIRKYLNYRFLLPKTARSAQNPGTVARPSWPASRLAGVASFLLPIADRARYSEEYRSELWDLAQAGAGRIRQLLCALRQIRNALPTNSALRSPRRKRSAS